MEENKKEENKKKKKTSIFFRNYAKDGKGVKKEDVITEYNFINFFKLYGRKFSKLVYVNFLYIFGNFPLLFFMLGISGYFAAKANMPTSEFYPIAYGLFHAGETEAAGTLFGLFGGVGLTYYYGNVASIVLFSISALAIFTFGPVNAGCAYLIKSLIKCEPIFLFEDFFRTIKTNLRQSIIVGIFDLAIMGASAYAVSFYLMNYKTYSIMFFCSLAMVCVYMFIRFYIYNILVTFKVSLRQLLKNSFILAILAMGKNFLALLAIVAFGLATFALSAVFMPAMVIILMMFFFSTVSFVATYVAYPKIKQYMIDPYYPNGEARDPDEPAEDESESEEQTDN